MTTALRTIDGIDVPAAGIWKIDPGHAEVGVHRPPLRAHEDPRPVHRRGGRRRYRREPHRVHRRPSRSTRRRSRPATSRDDHLRSGDFFDVEHHPTATFSTGVTVDGRIRARSPASSRSKSDPARHARRRVPRPRSRPVGQRPRRLHRLRHDQPRGLGPDMEHAARSGWSARLERDPPRDRRRAGPTVSPSGPGDGPAVGCRTWLRSRRLSRPRGHHLVEVGHALTDVGRDRRERTS